MVNWILKRKQQPFASLNLPGSSRFETKRHFFNFTMSLSWDPWGTRTPCLSDPLRSIVEADLHWCYAPGRKASGRNLQELVVPSLKLTAAKAPKNFWVWFPSSESPNFQGAPLFSRAYVCHVSFREGIYRIYIYQHWKLMLKVNAGNKTHHTWILWGCPKNWFTKRQSWEHWQENIQNKNLACEFVTWSRDYPPWN